MLRKKSLLHALAAGTVLAGLLSLTPHARAETAPNACPSDQAAGITLPPGFCATLFADNIGHARHIDIAADNTVYINTWSGNYYTDNKLPPGGFLVALRDTDHDGHADVYKRFGPGVSEGSAGGTGILLHDGWLYAEINDRIVRWRLPAGTLLPEGEPETIVSGLPTSGEHPMHQFVIDGHGNLFVNVGAATNACEIKLAVHHAPVHNPCTELKTRAGVWRFDAARTGQVFSEAARYATGIRNIGGIRIDDAGNLIVTQHGRDMLGQNWPDLYTSEQGAELPAEELLIVRKGHDYGWPTCYFDGFQQKLVLAPEYGGDGGHKRGICATRDAPVAFYPAHWAPDDLVFYRAALFPKAYQKGVFIAFHGSWNRAPHPQAGFKVVFQPLSGEKSAGPFTVFADGFPGKEPPDSTAYRPAGLAVGPDGALYVSDDTRGRIWRITYQGPADAPVTAAPAPLYHAQTATRAELFVPPGSTAAEVALGERIFNGKEKGGTCSGCHGTNGAGGGMGPALTTGTWLWGDGSEAAIEHSIRAGISTPRKASIAMPPLGGVRLDDADIRALAAYVMSISHRRN